MEQGRFGVYTAQGFQDFSDASEEEQLGVMALGTIASLLSFLLGGAIQEGSWDISVRLLAMLAEGREIVLTPRPTSKLARKLRPLASIVGVQSVPILSISIDGVETREALVRTFSDEQLQYVARGVLAYREDEELASKFPLPVEITFAGENADWQAVL